ncbi:Uncharacterized protein dnm_069420 [Desulfonema magnum]|uniref:Uncharacterized protein n=1 Tax=Desulfonema magnum TaxID=45655 RepID=A0A975BTH9_9BACT|nr:Uncharacterized protein dnm_069420 [Desulfonema magnum]
MQKTASLYFCTPDKKFSICWVFVQDDDAKNRFALFLHSG